MSDILDPRAIKAWQPHALVADGKSPLERARERVTAAGEWAPWQMLGRRMAIGCVALEITQRCNLDCSYCYLSESSEALKDIPLEEVMRRIDLIFAHYGPNTDIQVTGGDPTLRTREELVAIVRAIRSRGMRPSLFTNGIKATRELLAELSAAGLEDVAFHVDMTQQRAGFASERELNAVRLGYIERARGLPLGVYFNTTITPDNFHELPALVKFFVGQTDVVRLVSFQIGADIGRGVDRSRVTVNPDTVTEAIRAGAGAPLEFGAASVGHHDCNRYAYGLVVNGRVFDFLNDPAFVRETLGASINVVVARSNRLAMWRSIATFLLRHPRIAGGVLKRFGALVRPNWRDFVAARGKIRKLSFFVHNFMDARALDRARCEACSFMVMTPEGPMSMCVHNAKRDDYLLVPAKIKKADTIKFFNPATGALEDRMPAKIEIALSRKTARGRAKTALAAVRERETA